MPYPKSWSVKTTLLAGFACLLLGLCVMCLTQYTMLRRVEADGTRARALYGMLATQSLDVKSAVLFAAHDEQRLFATDPDLLWEQNISSLRMADEQAGQLRDLAERLPAGEQGRPIALIQGIRNDLALLAPLLQDVHMQSGVVAAIRQRLFSMITRPDPQPLADTAVWDAIMADQASREGLKSLRGQNEHSRSRVVALHTIRHDLSIILANVLEAITRNDLPLLDDQSWRFDALLAAAAKLETLMPATGPLFADLRNDVATYRDLCTQFALACTQFNEMTDRYRLLCRDTLIAATELIETSAMLQDAAGRTQLDNYRRLQQLNLATLALGVLLLVFAARYLYARCGRPLLTLLQAVHAARTGGVSPHAQTHGTEEFELLATRLDELLATQRTHIQELQDARTAADEACMAARNDAAAKTTFLARMSHELRTPLNGVLGMTYLTQKTDLTPKQKDYLNKIQSAAENLIGILDDILDFLKIESERLTLESVPFSLSELLDTLKENMGPQAKEKHLELDVRVAQDVPDALVGDPLRLGQVLSNLLSNALKFTEKGGISVEVDLADAQKLPEHNATLFAADAVRLHLRVRDSGIGMDRERMHRLLGLSPYDETDAPRKFGETGLGLTIAKRLVHLMNGTLWVHSAPGEGSDFHFTIICTRASNEQQAQATLPATPSSLLLSAEAPAAGQQAAPQRTGVDPDLRGFKVLLVEDNDINQQIGKELLTNCGLDVTTANDGAQAVELVRGRAFDLVFMDIQMPNMDGFEATRLIRSLPVPWARYMPVVAMTAHVLDSDKARSLEAGMQAHVTKPIHVDELHAVLLTWLKNDALRAQSLPISMEAPMSALDVSLGLHHLNGNEQLYNKLLRRFADSQAQVGQEVRTAMNNNDQETAIRTVHTLKGVAASLGASGLSTEALLVEQTLKEGDLPPDGLDALEAELARVLAAINERLG